MIMENVKKVLIAFFLSVILTDSVFEMGKSYYPQLLLEGWKYIVKDKQIY